MAKCNNCRSCMRIVRVTVEGRHHKVWYCYLCNKIYDFSNSRQEYQYGDIVNEVRDEYIKLYKGQLY